MAGPLTGIEGQEFAAHHGEFEIQGGDGRAPALPSGQEVTAALLQATNAVLRIHDEDSFSEASSEHNR
jgi:hypothetical protein